MKKYFLLVFLSLSMLATAQTNAVKLKYNGFIGLDYEHGFKGTHSAITFGPELIMKDQESVFSLNFGYRYYIHKNLNSLYVTPVFRFGRIFDEQDPGNLISLELLIGRQWIILKSLVFDINLGYGSFSLFNDVHQKNFNAFRFNIGFGYAF